MMMVVVAVEYYVYQLSPFGQVRFVWLGEKHQRLCVCQFKIISTPCCCNLHIPSQRKHAILQLQYEIACLRWDVGVIWQWHLLFYFVCCESVHC